MSSTARSTDPNKCIAKRCRRVVDVGLSDHERGGKHGGNVINHFADDFEEFASCIVAVDRWECDHIMAEAELIAIAGGVVVVSAVRMNLGL
jgi:hypothetical protein